MFCPNCKKALFDENHCNICGWTKEPERKINPQPPQEIPQPEEKQLPQSYYTDSWLLFTVVLLIGMLRLALAISTGGVFLYKAVINCLAAFIFLPQIKVDSESMVTIFIVKILAAAAVIIFI